MVKKLDEIKCHLTIEEKILLKKYKQMSDEELLQLIQNSAEEMGRVPTKKDVELSWYFKSRFGPWPRMLEQAGLKEVSVTYQRRKAANRRKRKTARKRASESYRTSAEGRSERE